VNDLGWSQTAGYGAQLLLQANPQTITQEGNQDVGFHTSLDPVKDRPQFNSLLRVRNTASTSVSWMY
jgi:hypothetical protein